MGSEKPIIGIDLGTTRCAVAYMGRDGQVSCVPGPDGSVLTPSCVWVRQDGAVVVGQAALEATTEEPDRVAAAFKRRMGQSEWLWKVDQAAYSPQALSGLLLERLVSQTESVIGPIDSAVITVPAYFGDRERTATLEAAHIAGIEVAGIINEPTAAALAGGFESYIAAGGEAADINKTTIAATAPAITVVCDLGGGTFDVTVLQIAGHDFDILATGGEPLGGRDFDEMIVELMTQHLFHHNGPDPHNDPRGRARMMLAAEKAKHILTVKHEVRIPCPYDRTPSLLVKRSGFEEVAQTLLGRVRDIVVRVLADARVTWPEVQELMLVGGASRMPMFRKQLGDLSNLKTQSRFQPDLIVAQGAAVYAAILRAQDRSSARAYALQLPDEPVENPARSKARRPRKRPATQWTDPTAQAAAESIIVRDVCSQSLGVIVYAPWEDRCVNAVVVPRNSRLPAMRTRVFATHEDDQRRVCIPVVEGDQRDPDACTPIGQCVIEDLPAGLPKGTPVEVTFQYDNSGRLAVQATELTSGKSKQVSLERIAATPPTVLDELAAAVAQMSSA